MTFAILFALGMVMGWFAVDLVTKIMKLFQRRQKQHIYVIPVPGVLELGEHTTTMVYGQQHLFLTHNDVDWQKEGF